MNNPDPEHVREVRAFTRFYTNILGMLHEGLLDTPYSATEARVLFELAQLDSAETADLRRMLDIDAGYLSRMISGFAANGLVRKRPSKTDGRRQTIALTDAGRAAFRTLDARSDDHVQHLLAGLTGEHQRRLVAGMRAVRTVLDPAEPAPGYTLRRPDPGDLGWVVHRHGVLYSDEYGWDASFEALVARIVADFARLDDATRNAAWIAEVDGTPAGCVFCVHQTDGVAALRLLLVEPGARGLGIGRKLVEECIRFARGAGYREITLWTNDVLSSARRVYQRAGFTLVNSEPHHSFGHDLVGENWALSLRPGTGGEATRMRRGR